MKNLDRTAGRSVEVVPAAAGSCHEASGPERSAAPLETLDALIASGVKGMEAFTMTAHAFGKDAVLGAMKQATGWDHALQENQGSTMRAYQSLEPTHGARVKLLLEVVFAEFHQASPDRLRIEYDPHFWGGDYAGTGRFLEIPRAAFGEDGDMNVAAAFTLLTGQDAVHIIHYAWCEDEA